LRVAFCKSRDDIDRALGRLAQAAGAKVNVR
jgi:hypothetical protein